MRALRKVEGFSPSSAAKLADSGISEEQAQSLGMYSVPDASKLHPGFEASPALVIPYYNAEKKPMAAHPAWPAFYRLRYLSEAPTVKGFAQAAGAKEQRYAQPPATGVCAYLPSCTDWKSIQDDTTEPILITEGELKAAKASLEGFPTIGLGGVYNFRSAKMGVFWLPELELFKWARRRVTVVYDSDYVDKPDICAAINSLAEELQERGALVELATLPNVYEEEDSKTGLDDFLVARNDDALIKIIRGADPLAMTDKLWKMNDQIAYVRNPGIVVVQKTGFKLAPTAFTAHSDWATENTPERKVKPDGSISYQKSAAAPIWIKWPLRRSVEKVTYAPGQPLFCEVEGHECYNQWRGWGVEPKKGDITPWLKLIEFIFEGAEKSFVEWFLDWCAYPLQNPGAKMYSAVVVHGRTTGTGKTLIGYTLGRIYGKNFTKIENKHLNRDFNSWAENRQFVLGDEISGTDKRSEADALKTIITQEEISINVKMLPEYTVPDCINYYFTSNHAEAFFLEDKDRRFAIHEVVHDKPLPDAFYKDYNEWRKSEEGPAALFHWLLQRKITNFNPAAAAPQTEAKKRMTMHGKSDLAIWCTELHEDPKSKLWLGKMRHTRDLFTSAELLAMYLASNDTPPGKVTANGMSRALAAAGFRQVNGGQPIPVNGKQGRYFIVRNEEEWRKKRVMRELTKHIEQAPVRDGK